MWVVINELLSTTLRKTNLICIYSTFPVFVDFLCTLYSPSCLGLKTARGPFGLRVKFPPAHLSATHGRGFRLSLFTAERKKGSCEYQVL